MKHFTNNSRLFAETTAAVLTANGIKAYIYKQLMPVSGCSFAIRKLGCDMGIMITASHNPKKYNGYKVYNNEGCQIIGSDPADILAEIEKVDIFDDVKSMTFDEALAYIEPKFWPDERKNLISRFKKLFNIAAEEEPVSVLETGCFDSVNSYQFYILCGLWIVRFKNVTLFVTLGSDE